MFSIEVFSTLSVLLIKEVCRNTKLKNVMLHIREKEITVLEVMVNLGLFFKLENAFFF